MKRQEGFTLLELLIVIGILGALAALALPRFMYAVDKAKTNSDRGNIQVINTQIELYNLDTSFYVNDAGLQTIFETVSYFPDGYPRDPFSNLTGTVAYTINTTKYRISPHLSTTDGTHVGWRQ